MKKIYTETIVAYLSTLPEDTVLPNPHYNGEPNIRPNIPVSEILENMNAETAKNAEKASANRDLYAAAYDVVARTLTYTPVTVSELWDACGSEMPEGFTKGKLQYAMSRMWDFTKVDMGRGANTYRLRATSDK